MFAVGGTWQTFRSKKTGFRYIKFLGHGSLGIFRYKFDDHGDLLLRAQGRGGAWGLYTRAPANESWCSNAAQCSWQNLPQISCPASQATIYECIPGGTYTHVCGKPSCTYQGE